jgi:hypothetical protein
MAVSVLKKIGWTFLILCGIVPFAAIVVIFVLHPTKGMSDPLTWLSVISTVVGAIGAVGGIVVGMISLITLSQIDKQVKAEFDQRYQKHQRALDEQSTRWASGVKLWAQASMMDDLGKATATLEKGLEMWPTAPNARTEMLARFYEPTERAFLLDLIPERRQNLERMDSIRSIRSGYIIEWPESYLNRCIEWLTLADNFERLGNELQLDYLGSKINAMAGNFTKALERLNRYVTAGGSVLAWDVFVLAGCAETLQDVVSLKSLIKGSTFQDIDEVITNMKERLANAQNGHCLEHYISFELNSLFGFKKILQISYTGEKWMVRKLPAVGESKSFESDDELRDAFQGFQLVGPLPNEYSLP